MFPLQSITIKNFRGIRNLELPLHESATVLFGRNAAGKTTIVDALCIGLGAIAERMPGSTARDFAAGDVRRGGRIPGETAGAVAAFASVFLQAQGEVAWQVVKRRDPTVPLPPSPGRKALHAWLDPRITAIQEKRDDVAVALPLIAAYGPERAVMEIPVRQPTLGRDFPRLAGLADALKATTRFKSVFEWFGMMEDEERRAQVDRKEWSYKLPELEWVRRAIQTALPACQNPRTDTRPIRLLVDFAHEDGVHEALDLKELSDGYRTHFALVADLARRAVQLNPSDDLKSRTHGTNSAGVVLIDEIDLHLHPFWQTTVLPDLMRAFPNVQFVVTTHSEQVISSVRKEQVYALETERGQVVAKPVAFAQGASGERVLAELMDVPARVPGEVTDQLERYLNLVDLGDGDSPAAQALRQTLDEELRDDPLLIRADAKMERARLLAGTGRASGVSERQRWGCRGAGRRGEAGLGPFPRLFRIRGHAWRLD